MEERLSVIMTQDFGRYHAGETVVCESLKDVRFLVDQEQVAERATILRARQVVDAIDVHSEENRNRVWVTSLQQQDIEAFKTLSETTVSLHGVPFPLFNPATHTFVDLERVQDDTRDSFKHTVSIRLPNGDFLTVAIVPMFNDDATSDGCIDIQYHGDKTKRILGFNGEAQGAGTIDDPALTFHTLTFETKPSPIVLQPAVKDEKPTNAAQLIAWNKEHAGSELFHILRIFDVHTKTLTTLRGLYALKIFKAQTNACIYKNNGESYRSDYGRHDEFAFHDTHYVKTSTTNNSIFIAEYWYNREDAERRLFTLDPDSAPRTTEWCHHCDTEVEIPATMDAHTCPACGKRLLPCSHCRETYPKYSCVLCPLEDER